MKSTLVAVASLTLACTSLQAQLVVYSFTGAAGSESSFPADSQPANLTAGSIQRGPGLTANANANTFSSSGFTTGLSVDLDDYYSITLTPHEGYAVTLTSLRLDERRSATGIRGWAVRSSLDSFGTSLATFSVPDDTATRTAQTTTFNASFQNLLSPVELRIYGYAAESAAGTWRVDNVGVFGAVSAVPEPRECMLLAGLALVGFAAWRRRLQPVV